MIPRDWCSCELTETMTASTRPAQVQVDKCPAWSQGSGHKVPSPTKKLFATESDWKGKICFFTGVTVVYQHTLGQALCPVLICTKRFHVCVCVC